MINFGLEKIFSPRRKKESTDINKYLEDIASGKFRDKLVFGVTETDNKFHTADQIKSPNAIYCGGMGSGKSVACCFTTLTHYLANSDRTIYVIMDLAKGANDYSALFGRPNVYTVIMDEDKTRRMIELVYDEILARGTLFNKYLCENIKTYEKVTQKKMARILITIEE